MNTLVLAGLNNAVSASFLAVVVACLGRPLARRPAILHCLWFLVLLKLVTPPVYEVSIPWIEPFQRVMSRHHSITANPATDSRVDLVAVELHPAEYDPTAQPETSSLAWSQTAWKQAIGTLWLAGTAATLLLSAWRIRQFQHLLNEAKPASERVQERVDDLAADLGIGRPPGLWWIPGKLSPMLWALGRSPRLIIPIELWKSLDDRQRTTLLVHELAHLRRGDHHLRIFELLVTALYWWHPVLWWARRALRDVEEQCCDAWVVWAFPDAARSYAETLLETLDFLDQSDRAQPLLASGFGKVHHLRKRLTMIMNGNTPRTLSLGGALGALSLAVLLLPFNASWGQKPDEPDEVEVIVNSVDERAQPVTKTVTIRKPVSVVVDEFVTSSTFPAIDQAVTFVTKSPSFDDAKTTFHLEIKSDGSAYVIDADSIKDAIRKLSDQVKQLSKKAPLSEQDKKTVNALEGALASLKHSAKVVDEVNASADKAKVKSDVRKIVIRKLGKDGKILTDDVAGSPREVLSRDKKRAEREAIVQKLKLDERVVHQNDERTRIRQEIEKLRAELVQKSRQLEAVQIKLSKIERDGATKTLTIQKDVPSTPRMELQIRSEDGQLKAKATTIGARKPGSDPKRIDELEKSLEKLFQEVARLKKNQAE